MEATRDRLHQEYRRSAMPQSLALVDWLRSRRLDATQARLAAAARRQGAG